MKQDFRMKILAYPRTTMRRQCTEGHEINKLEPGTFINRKREWVQSLPIILTRKDPDEPQEAKIPNRGKRKDSALKKPLDE